MEQPTGYTIQQIFEIAEQQEAILARQCYFEDDCVVLNVEYPYAVELARLNTKAKILHWVRHLAGKNWATLEILMRFVDLACKHHGFDPHTDSCGCVSGRRVKPC
jgi:hypothetical protein